jgi:hypothetical protein
VATPGVAATSLALPPAIPTPDASEAPYRTYRALLRKGLTIAEATNLTAYLCGIPLNDVQWSLAQVNKLLFVRELHRTGRIGEDAVSAPPQ